MAPSSKENKLSKLFTKRKIVLKRLSAFEIYLKNLKPENLSLGEFKVRLAKVNACWDEFDTVQGEIEVSVDDDLALEQEEIRENFEASYYAIVGAGEEILTRHSRMDSPHASSANLASTTHTHREMKLPVLSIPTFSGSYEEWFSFKNSFMDIVDNNQSLPDGMKLRYLKGALRGEAAQVIEAFEIVSENYREALKLLADHFENTALIVQNHIRDLFNIHKIDHDSAPSLRTLLSTSRKHIRALKSLKQPTDQWDLVLVHLLTSKFDTDTFKEWQQEIPSKELPNMAMLIEFMERKLQILEAVQANSPLAKSKSKTFSTPQKDYESRNSHCFVTQHNDSNQACVLCFESHRLYSCPKYRQMSVDERFKVVKLNRLCLVCLLPGHQLETCKMKGCPICKRDSPHNSTLCRFATGSNVVSNTQVSHQQLVPPAGSAHRNPVLAQQQSQSLIASGANAGHHLPVSSYSTTMTSQVTQPSSILLSTALVMVHGPSGKRIYCRALLDCGSQSNFICSHVCDWLGLEKIDVSTNICGLNSSVTPINKFAQPRISSRTTSFSRQLDMFVVPKITDYVPSNSFDIRQLKLPPHIILADPKFNESSQIDMLIGAEVFWDLIGSDHFELENTSLSFHESKLGWIASGRLSDAPSTNASKYYCNLATEATSESIDANLHKFWESEDLDSFISPTNEEPACENHFIASTVQDDSSHYIVKTPIEAAKLEELGDGKSIALKKFAFLGRRFAKDPELHRRHSESIHKYSSLGHMALFDSSDHTLDKVSFYVPHHPVFKESSSTTTLPSVLSFSGKSLSGYSLSNISSKGFVVQNPKRWRHVSTSEISASPLFRRVFTDQLRASSLLWKWPPWLSTQPTTDVDRQFAIVASSKMSDTRKEKIVALSTTDSGASHINQILIKFSSFDHAIRVFAYCLQFLCRMKITKGLQSTGAFTASNLNEARAVGSHLSQRLFMYPLELECNKTVQRRCSLRMLGKIGPHFIHEASHCLIEHRIESK